MKSMSNVIVLAALCVACVPAATASEAISKAGGCSVCHTVDKKIVGPTYKEIAAKYKGDAAAPARLADHVRKGSKGIWGQVPMLPTPASKLNDNDLKAVIAWILKS